MFDFADFQSRAQKIVDHFQQDIAVLRTGRAHTSLLDTVLVEVYGTKMKVAEVANVAAPDPTLLTVSPWDKTIIDQVSKAIAVSGLNLNPVVDGDMIRISIPPLTQERRQEMVKLLAQKTEAAKVMVRNLRGDVRKEIESMKGDDGVSEDDISGWLEELDAKVKQVEEQVEQIKQKKEKELMTL